MQFLIWLRRFLTTALTAVAFWNSYTHTKSWFADNGQAAQAGWLALIPEAGLVMVVITLAMGGLNVPVERIVRTIGAGALAITLTANLAGAAPGLMGIVAALVAPVFAILGFALEVLSLAPAPKPKRKPAAKKKEPPSGRKPSLVDSGILWATSRGGEWPTTAQVMEQYPTISRTTAQKISAARPVSAR
jgi:hypothetical protein